MLVLEDRDGSSGWFCVSCLSCGYRRGALRTLFCCYLSFFGLVNRETEKDTRKREDDAAMRMRSEKGAERQGKKKTT